MAKNRLILQGKKRRIIIQNDNSQNYLSFINWVKELQHFSKVEEDIVFFFPDDKYIAQCSLKAKKLGLIIT